MSIIPSEVDFRGEIAAKIDLVKINTTEGDFRFIVGLDGVFRDVFDNEWIGSQLISTGSQEIALNGKAPSGELSFSFFQDPSMPDLVNQVRDLGLDYVRDRDITFYVQPFADVQDIYRPTIAPIQILKRKMKSITFRADGEMVRTISVSFESAWENRRAQRRRIYNTADHSALAGSPNPSLQFIPTSNFQEEKLFG